MEAMLATRYQFVVENTSSRIHVDFVGAGTIDLEDGVLIARNGPHGQWRPSPRAHQVLNGINRAVDVRFDREPQGGVDLVVGSHDSGRPLFIELVDIRRNCPIC